MSLLAALEANDAVLVAALIESGADLEEEIRGDSPLGYASRVGHAQFIRLLLSAKANVNPTPKRGMWTPLLRAARQGHADVVRMLIEAKADVKWASDSGYTALSLAVSDGTPEVVRLLLEAGALDPKAAKYPLEEAISRGRQAAAEVLIDFGASLSKLNSRVRVPEWAFVMENKRNCCKAGVLVLFGVLRKRYLQPQAKVPRDMCNLLAAYLWSTRKDDRWNLVVDAVDTVNFE